MRDIRLPNVIFIGPTRTGTTWIHHYLSARKDVSLPADKETYYFDQRFARGLSWYKDQFNYIDGAPVVEVGPTYFYCDEAPDRMKHTLKDFKVVVILRNQADLAYSTFSYNLQYGRGVVDFEQFLANKSSLEYLRYSERVKKWISVIGAENIYFLKFDDFRKSNNEFIESICDILGLVRQKDGLDGSGLLSSKVNKSGGVPKHAILARIATNASSLFKKTRLSFLTPMLKKLGLKKLIYAPAKASMIPKMTREQRSFVLTYFSSDVAELESIVNMDLKFMKV